MLAFATTSARAGGRPCLATQNCTPGPPSLPAVSPPLSPAQAQVLALWTIGLLLARCCGLSAVACQLALLLGQSDNTTRQRLREFYQEAPAKAGAKRGIKRRDLRVTACFAPLLRWVLSFWSCDRLALALDVTNLSDRFHVLAVSVLYGGIGIPVAWKILPANQKDAWHPHWCALLGHVQAAVPPGWTVVVLSDRGLESPRLFQAVVAVGWHPLLRVKAGGKFRPAGWVRWYAFARLVPRVGSRFAVGGVAYKTAAQPLACTFLGCWDEGHAEPWLLLTDLPVGAASPCWYAFRAWIEQGFKVIKSGALQWQHTRMRDPARAERLWLALAVTLLWLVVIGAAVEGDQRQETVGALPARTEPARPRRHRQWVLGLAAWRAALACGRPLPLQKLPPEPWPEAWQDVPTVTEQEFWSDKTYP
jgi:Transposase DDE domain